MVHIYVCLKTLLSLCYQVVYNERDGKSGYGVVVQDINATNTICMDKICDLPNYNKMVPHVRSVELYDQEKLANVSAQLSTAGQH